MTTSGRELDLYGEGRRDGERPGAGGAGGTEPSDLPGPETPAGLAATPARGITPPPPPDGAPAHPSLRDPSPPEPAPAPDPPRAGSPPSRGARDRCKPGWRSRGWRRPWS
jgi:hypothetical protein